MSKISFLNIFKIFLKIGVILLGGGYVIMPIMAHELVEKRNWLNQDELCDFYCVSQCLPGIIAINMSILVGYKLYKFKGVLASIIGISFSPILSILLIANFVDKINNLPFIQNVFWGINISVIILIYLALKEMWQKSITNYFSFFWFLFILILFSLKISPVILILISILFGIAFYFIKEQKNG